MIRISVVSLLFFILLGSAQAAYYDGFEMDAKSREIMARYSKNALSEVNDSKNYYCEYEICIEEGKGKAKKFDMASWHKGGKSRNKMTVFGNGNERQDMVTIFDGTSTWMIMPGMKYKAPGSQSGQQAKDYAEQYLKGMSENHTGKNSKLKGYINYIGSEAVDGVACHVLVQGVIVKGIKKPDYKMYLEQDSGRMTRASSKDVEVRITDYRTVKGMAHPFKRIFTSKKIKQTTIVKVLEVDEPMEDSLFDPDASAAASAPAKPQAETTTASDEDQLFPSQTGNGEEQSSGSKNSFKKEAGKAVFKGILGIP
ncbi:MAG: hypothetical protein A2219_03210 [Elusimicrobia bacterium RIFOXYA2_FULL_50_26]|nr:MAG: hypothetical protein A2219_03210 [Elusimicrobia bacterium RIFOXYA2_FULL_50_26]OGS24947.1 MAG: hypothetical protein A2314_07925 [Elusimicrobia bacterium RIFOXYB2_FULL_50_12]